MSKFKAFADNNLNVAKMAKFICDNVKTRCVCETLMPRNTHLLRNMTLIFDLDLCRLP